MKKSLVRILIAIIKGEEQVANLRVLLTDVKGANAIVNYKDTIYSTIESYENLYNELDEVEVARVILSADDATPDVVKNRFEIAISNTNIGSVYTNNMGKNRTENPTENPTGLIGGMHQIIKVFNLSYTTNSIENQIKSLFPIQLSTDFQYRYYLLKDLVATYNEIKSLILHLKFQCSPDIHAFSKHILLGPIGAELVLGEDTPFRHDFYKATILANDGENLKKLIFLVDRFVEKVNSAFVRALSTQIKITPSLNSLFLGNRAIPFYYNVSDRLIKNWNYQKTERRKEKYNLSYHNGNLSQETFVQNPLLFSLEDFDFLRIEGHIGKDYKLAYDSINDIRVRYGLPFKVMVLGLNEVDDKDTINPPISQTEFEKRLQILSEALDSRNSTNPEVAETLSILNRQKSFLPELESSIEKFKKEEKSTEIMEVSSRAKLELSSGFEARALTSKAIANKETRGKKKDEEKIEVELLSDFMERNTGLEHKGGVDLGGTFILMTYSDKSGSSLVVADFALPYICCSKKDPVLLSIPADKMCAYEEAIPLAVVPIDGEVQAFVGAISIPGIVRNGDQSLFNPGLVPAQYHGQTITFQVNEEAIESQITVYLAPEITVEVGEILYDDNAENAKVTFNVNSVNNSSLSNLAFNWNFGDGQQSTAVPVNGKVQHTYALKPGEEGRFLPRVSITNTVAGENICATVIDLEVSLKLVINKDTKIRIYFDSSGSMNTSLNPLKIMRQTILKKRLLPLYGDDSDAYDKNVSVINFWDERTIKTLNMNGETPEGNVIVLVFQDEANPTYHTSSISSRTTSFNSDITEFRKRLSIFSKSNPNYYRGVVFQVDGNKVFPNLMKAVELGNDSNYPSGFNLSDRKEVQFVYNVEDGATSDYYLGLIVQALIGLGFDQLKD